MLTLLKLNKNEDAFSLWSPFDNRYNNLFAAGIESKKKPQHRKNLITPLNNERTMPLLFKPLKQYRKNGKKLEPMIR